MGDVAVVDDGVDDGVGGEDEGGVGAVLSLLSPPRYKHVPAVFPNIQNPPSCKYRQMQ